MDETLCIGNRSACISEFPDAAAGRRNPAPFGAAVLLVCVGRCRLLFLEQRHDPCEKGRYEEEEQLEDAHKNPGEKLEYVG